MSVALLNYPNTSTINTLSLTLGSDNINQIVNQPSYIGPQMALNLPDAVAFNQQINFPPFSGASVDVAYSSSPLNVNNAPNYQVGENCTYTTIQSAINQAIADRASSFFTGPINIYVSPVYTIAGTYDEDITLNDTSINLIAQPPSGNIGNNNISITGSITVLSGNVGISGFSLNINGSLRKLTVNASSLVLENCSLSVGGGTSAFYFQGNHNSIYLQSCNISSNDNSATTLFDCSGLPGSFIKFNVYNSEINVNTISTIPSSTITSFSFNSVNSLLVCPISIQQTNPISVNFNYNFCTLQQDSYSGPTANASFISLNNTPYTGSCVIDNCLLTTNITTNNNPFLVFSTTGSYTFNVTNSCVNGNGHLYFAQNNALINGISYYDYDGSYVYRGKQLVANQFINSSSTRFTTEISLVAPGSAGPDVYHVLATLSGFALNSVYQMTVIAVCRGTGGSISTNFSEWYNTSFWVDNTGATNLQNYISNSITTANGLSSIYINQSGGTLANTQLKISQVSNTLEILGLTFGVLGGDTIDNYYLDIQLTRTAGL